MGKKSEENNIFVCPGNCEACDLKSTECPNRGKLDSDMSDRKEKILQRLQEMIMTSQRTLIGRISPEFIVKGLKSELFRLAQLCEIEEENDGPIVTVEMFKEKIMQLNPIFDCEEWDIELKKRLDVVVASIAVKLMEIKQRACRDQGSTCRKCYMRDVCLQYLQLQQKK